MALVGVRADLSDTGSHPALLSGEPSSGEPMTKGEYQELIEFLGRKFEDVDQRFVGMERRFDAVDARFDAVELRLTRVEVLGERNQHHIDLLAEGLGGLRQEMNERFEAVDYRMAEGFASLRLEVTEGFRSLDRRVGRLEGRSRGSG
jgi:hypothetical protein